MFVEVILRCFYTQVGRFHGPFMDIKRQPMAARPIPGSLISGDSGHTKVSRSKLDCLSSGLPDPICVSNLPGHSFRFNSSRKAPQDLFNTKMYMRELSFPCLVTLQVVKASRSYFSSYRGSPQTKVSGGSKKGSRRSGTGSDSRI